MPGKERQTRRVRLTASKLAMFHAKLVNKLCDEELWAAICAQSRGNMLKVVK